MAFRGYFAINGVEIVNSSRTFAHLGRDSPTLDSAVFNDVTADCSLVPTGTPGLYEMPSDSFEVSPGLWSPPGGSRRAGPGLLDIDGSCWGEIGICAGCRTSIVYDDSWPGLRAFLGFDTEYRPELAPWYTTDLPESGEFGGVWLTNVTGLDSTPVQREIVELVGDGAMAAPHRDTSRVIAFDALLIGCTNAGVDYGLKWLTCLLRDTIRRDDSVLRYLSAHPGHSGVDPISLVRDAHNVVLTKAPEVVDSKTLSANQNQQATMYYVHWELTSLSSHVYMPAVLVDADWDSITRQSINWIHAAHCPEPVGCGDMPVLFSTECVPQEIEVIDRPPPVCGGCLPVGEIDKYSFRVPTMDYAFRCGETAVTTLIRNLSDQPLTLQGFWRICGTDTRCEDDLFPVQVSGLPAGASLHLDGITGRFWAVVDGQKRRPVGIVGTPHGAPWRPPLIDRETCWNFVVQAAGDADFEVSFALADREA